MIIKPQQLHLQPSIKGYKPKILKLYRTKVTLDTICLRKWPATDAELHNELMKLLTLPA